MAKTIEIAALGFLIFFISTVARANDPPHNASFGVSCASCHGKVLIFNDPDYTDDILQSPFWGGETGIGENDSLDDYPINRLCQTCHWTLSGFSATNAPLAKTHSCYHYLSEGGSELWSWLCIDCHDPHQQQQKRYDTSEHDDSLYLATGIIQSYTYDNDTDTSILTYHTESSSEFYTARPGWENVDKHMNKTGINRGTIILPDKEMKSYTYSIVSIHSHTNQIVVRGDVRTGVYLATGPTDPEVAYEGCPQDDPSCEAPLPGQDNLRYFGIMYGQMIKQVINGKTVRFYDQTGANSYADGDATRDGVCEVCHTQTKYFNNNDSNPFLLHSDNPTYYKNETYCGECHHHEKGFSHFYDAGRMKDDGSSCVECHYSGKHIGHLTGGESCSTCHNIDTMRDNDDVVFDPRIRVISNDSGVLQYPCDDCHHDGRGGIPNVTDYKSHWYDENYQMGCDGCHNGRPAQLDPGNEDRLYHAQVNDSCFSRTGDEYLCALLNDSCVSRTGDDYLCWIPEMVVNDSCYAWTLSNDSCLTVQNKVMDTDGHHRLVGEFGIRQYSCYNCHDKTVDADWNLKSDHTNGTINVHIDENWAITGLSAAAYYNKSDNNCYNVYCHSDGTYLNPEVRPYPWNEGSKSCNSCHGHNNESDCSECHTDGSSFDNSFLYYSAMPMYENQGAGADRANTHLPHVIGRNKPCNECHADTVYGSCTDCHLDENDSPVIPVGEMEDLNHIKPAAHVNKIKTVKFSNSNGGTAYYDPDTKTCYNTICHTSQNPQWGGELAAEICFNCHGASQEDIDDYGTLNGIQARINLTQWYDRGHGRSNDSGPYDQSGNPAANFPTNGCWYCHDPKVSHRDAPAENPFRLRRHASFEARFAKECEYCHMSYTDDECLSCHNQNDSLAVQLSDLPEVSNDSTDRPDHTNPLLIGNESSCGASGCHVDDASRHKVGSDKVWSDAEKADVKNQYVQMGVCLKCHDDDSGNQCASCHPGDGKYALGFDPQLEGTSYRAATTAKASSAHFGYKHYDRYIYEDVWKGGKFCWDCHDPHGDSNIFMIHDQVTLESDGTFGIPTLFNDSTRAQAEVVFLYKHDGIYYAGEDPGPYNKICNVCHSGTTGHNDTFIAAHYTSTSGDGHNISRPCTECHEHKFTDSHSGTADCNTCHLGKPVPRHSAFGLPRDCTKCHKGIRSRMDIMGQFYANSHHVQNPDEYINNKHCYPCHWESTEEGLIDVRYHEGYNYITHLGSNNDKVDLVVVGDNTRPTEYIVYNDSTRTGTATQFRANTMGTEQERANIEQITPHCLSCHSEKNNDWEPFEDCKTPNHYSWDSSSIDVRYSDTGTTSWGKYAHLDSTSRRNYTKAYSAHGNAVANQGGFSPTTGLDGDLSGHNTRNGSHNVQCFDCHSSHGSKVGGITSSYVSFEGSYNGANLKETAKGTGGYIADYKATANPNPVLVNAYNPGAGQCFDCHETKFSSFNSVSKTPWGYNDTYGASMPIIGYRDNPHFKGTAYNGVYQYKTDHNIPTLGSHLNAEDPPLVGVNGASPPQGVIRGLCTPCHDPHGISPTLGANKEYAVPLLKGTYLTSPYVEDKALPSNIDWNSQRYSSTGPTISGVKINDILESRQAWVTDRNTFYAADVQNRKIVETDEQFAGLCLQCHPKASLTDGSNNNTAFKTLDRVHETVKGWGDNLEHNYPCSKCHKAHSSGLPRLLSTNCLDAKHRGRQVSGGFIPYGGAQRSTTYKRGSWPEGLTGTKVSPRYIGRTSCHYSSTTVDYTKEQWNNVNGVGTDW